MIHQLNKRTRLYRSTSRPARYSVLEIRPTSLVIPVCMNDEKTTLHDKDMYTNRPDPVWIGADSPVSDSTR